MLIGAMLALSVILQLAAVESARSSLSGDGVMTQPSLAVPTVLTTLATFCVSVAVVLVVGIVATYVVDLYLPRLADDTGDGDGGGAGAGLAAYGSDPERL
jgi:hypothetical protein